MKASCDLDTQLWQSKYMPGWNADITTEAIEIVNKINHTPEGKNEGRNVGRNLDPRSGSGVVCDEWVDHPVLIVQRDTFANFFHDRCVLCAVCVCVAWGCAVWGAFLFIFFQLISTGFFLSTVFFESHLMLLDLIFPYLISPPHHPISPPFIPPLLPLSEDFFNVFIAMAVLEWKKKDTQIFLTDLYPKGPFWYLFILSIYSFLFN